MFRGFMGPDNLRGFWVGGFGAGFAAIFLREETAAFCSAGEGFFFFTIAWPFRNRNEEEPFNPKSKAYLREPLSKKGRFGAPGIRLSPKEQASANERPCATVPERLQYRKRRFRNFSAVKPVGNWKVRVNFA
jgi:hypothetical protein